MGTLATEFRIAGRAVFAMHLAKGMTKAPELEACDLALLSLPLRAFCNFAKLVLRRTKKLHERNPVTPTQLIRVLNFV